MSSAIATAAVSIALAVPAAEAKGPAEAELCGSSGCVRLSGSAALEPFSSWWKTPFTQLRKPKPARFYRILVRQAEPEPITWSLVYVPARNAMRLTQSRVPPYATGIGPYWRTVPAPARRGLRDATRGTTPYPASAAYSVCRVTDVRGRPVPETAQPSFNYGNETIRVALAPPDGQIVAGLLPGGGMRATINADGSIDAKVGWWRAGSGRPVITGRRIDRYAAPLRAHVPGGYSAGFQATGLTFPTTGCWRVRRSYGGASLTCTVRVTRSRLLSLTVPRKG